MAGVEVEGMLHQNMTMVCYPTSPVTSHGLWVGGLNLLHYSLPLIMFQISVVVIASRVTQLLLKPLRQPSSVSYIIGGILLGPSGLGWSPKLRHALFPKKGVFLVEVMAILGLIYQTFSIAVKMNLSKLVMGRKPLTIMFVGLVWPMATYIFFSILLLERMAGHFGGMTAAISLGSSLTLSSFAMIFSFLSDFHLLNSDLGRLSLTIATLNDAFGWGMMVYVNFLALGEFGPKAVVLGMIPTVITIGMAVFVIRPLLLWVNQRTPEGRKLEQGLIVTILLGTIVVAMITDRTGLSIVEGSIMLGLVIPNGPPLGATIEQKVDTVAKEIFMPLFYASIGQKVNIFDVADWYAFGVLVFLVLVNTLAKLLGTIITALCFRLPFMQALSLAFLLNTKGYYDLMVYKGMESAGMMDGQSISALVLSAVVITMIESILIAKFNRQPGKYTSWALRTIQHSGPLTELRIVACIHDEHNVLPILNVLEATNATEDNPVCVYVMQLVELVGRATPMLISHRPDKKSAQFSGPVAIHIFTPFYNYQKRSTGNSLFVQALTSIAPYKTMHNDVCSLAVQKKASLILVPFHKRQVVPGVTNTVDNALKIINSHILAQAPCSVGIVFDRGSLRGMFALDTASDFRIGVLFFGGPDDREALSYAVRMSQHPSTSLTVMRFIAVEQVEEYVMERKLDDELVAEFQGKCFACEKTNYEEQLVFDGEDTMNVICSIQDPYDLMVVGRRQCCNLILVEGLGVWSENPELGVIGDLCSSSDFFGGKASVLVMQQQTPGTMDLKDSFKSCMIPQFSSLHSSSTSRHGNDAS